MLGAACGLVALVVAVIAYYLLIGVLGRGIRSIGAAHAATVWGVVAVVAGPVMGAAGATWRHGRGWPRAIAVALLASALLAEGVAFGGSRWVAWVGPADDPGAILFAAEAAVGIVLPALLLDRGERLRGYLALAALAALGLVAIGPVIDLVRGLADRF